MSDHSSDLTHLPDLHHKPEHGPVRSRRPIYQDLLPPCNHACPAGEKSRPGSPTRRPGGTARRGELLVQDNPLPAIHGRVCYHPCETALQPRAQLDGAVSIHAVERFLGDLAHRAGLARARRRGGTRQARARRRRRAERPVGRLSPARDSATRSRSARPARARRHDALRHPGLPPAARGARRRGRAASRRLGVAIVLDHKVEDLRGREARGRLRRRLPRHRRAPVGKRAGHPRARRGPDARRRLVPARRRGRHTRRSSAGASPSTAAATPRWTPRARRKRLGPTSR